MICGDDMRLLRPRKTSPAVNICLNAPKSQSAKSGLQIVSQPDDAKTRAPFNLECIANINKCEARDSFINVFNTEAVLRHTWLNMIRLDRRKICSVHRNTMARMLDCLKKINFSKHVCRNVIWKALESAACHRVELVSETRLTRIDDRTNKNK